MLIASLFVLFVVLFLGACFEIGRLEAKFKRTWRPRPVREALRIAAPSPLQLSKEVRHD